ncbi:DNA polymerase II [Candidatus Woesearchaeota archaeon]|nr:DNA polymerase II [Candidatus Woesearchaeota archaeon]|tara:strand:+ start:1688 stop:3160 length:1473 start_codon:yes stop_codon:yes gene_type:complete
MERKTKQEIIGFLLDKGLLVTDDVLDKISSKEELESLYNIIKENNKLLFLDSKTFSDLRLAQQGGQTEAIKEDKKVKILFSYEEESRKRKVQDFIAYFNKRYGALSSILQNRAELSNLVSINRLQNKSEREKVSIIGIIKEKNITKTGNVIMELEDPTGCVKVCAHINKPELVNKAKGLVLDEVIGLSGPINNGLIFADAILFPDVPFTKELKKSREEEYAVFISDLHVGSNNFMEKEFIRFVNWTNGNLGDEKQRELSAKIKYLFIVGDLIDGAGIYPGQEDELTIKDIHQQYHYCAELLRKISPEKELIICPGNHDSMRIAEPQPVLYKDFAKPLWELPNVTMVSNPAQVNIGSYEGFPGFDVLLYHGYSFDYFVANVENIRNKGGYDRPDLIMKFLLQKRHLAPTHASTLYIPEQFKDPLVIDSIPDIFVTGHIHKSSVSNYRNITLICGSCWQSKTAFQEKVGHHPEPCRVPIVNLKTREVKVLRF